LEDAMDLTVSFRQDSLTRYFSSHPPMSNHRWVRA
jgi:hypothetical protein